MYDIHNIDATPTISELEKGKEGKGKKTCGKIKKERKIEIKNIPFFWGGQVGFC